MAVVLDAQARREIEERRRRGHDVTVHVYCRSVARAGAAVSIGWAADEPPAPFAVAQHVDGLTVWLAPRIARYAQSQTVAITAVRKAFLHRLAVADPYLMNKIGAWERARVVERAEHLTEVSPRSSRRQRAT